MSNDNILKLRNFSILDFLIELRNSNKDEKEIIINISGSFTLMHPEEVLKPYLEELHRRIIENGVKTVKLHFEKFDSLNSSALKIFVNWFDNIKHLDKNELYTIKFIYNSEIPWQKSFYPVVEKILPKLESFDIN